MPGKWVRGLIVLLWATVSGLAAREQLLPRLFPAPANYQNLAADLATETSADWRIRHRGEPLGRLRSRVQPLPNGEVSLTSVANLDRLPLPLAGKSSSLRLESETRLSATGHLAAFDATVTLKDGPNGGNLASLTVRGAVVGDVIDVKVDGLEGLPIPRALKLPIGDRRMLVADALSPVERLPNLFVGANWTSRTLDPTAVLFRSELAFDDIAHRVVAEQSIDWDGQSVPCFRIEHRHREVTARTWARRADGLVLRHEAPFQGGMLELDLEPAGGPRRIDATIRQED